LASATTRSRYGDFIDSLPSDEISWKDYEEKGFFTVVKGANYKKTDEVPDPTDVQILTASSIDADSCCLLSDQKVRYLKDAKKVSSGMRPKPLDIVISFASGSLSALGKIAMADNSVDAYIGGFLKILRPKSLVAAKVLQYNLLSARFRKFIIELKGQNISNLTLGEIRQFILKVPKDSAAFVLLCEQKEGKSLTYSAKKVTKSSNRKQGS